MLISRDQVTSLRDEKKTLQQQIHKLQGDLEEQQRENDELKFDYDRTTKEVCSPRSWAGQATCTIDFSDTKLNSIKPVRVIFCYLFHYFCSPTFHYTRSSADADNRFDAFSGQSRSTNIVPFHMLHIVCYCAIVTCL